MTERTTRSGLPLQVYYDASSSPVGENVLRPPGEAPFVRGITPDGYRSQPWVMGQYGGFGTPEESNERLKQIIAAGQTGFSVALDLPTQMGLDSDHPLSHGEVGKVGVPIDSLRDIEILFDGVDLTSLRQIRTTANAIGHIWLALIVALCEKNGTDPNDIGVLIQNDVLKEYFARGTYIHPPEEGMRIVADVIEYCAHNLPNWTPVTLSGYHIREAGADAVQEVAFSIANGIAYLEAAIDKGLSVDSVAPSLFTFLSTNIDFLEEVAKFRAARLTWARVISERFAAQDPRSGALRIFAFTAGSSLTAQQPLNNAVRTALESLAAVLGGVQTLHVSGYDEALGVPTKEAAMLGLRTQQVILEESGVAGVADALGGSWAIESLTTQLAERIWAELEKIDAMGGALTCIHNGYFAGELSEGAYRFQLDVESGRTPIVGVNVHREDSSEPVRPFSVDRSGEDSKVAGLATLRTERDADVVAEAIARLQSDARSGANLIPATIQAVKAYATVGEITEALTAVFGRHQPT
ncbi:methylmalonyl-CoA mutase family protein [Intrasporangium calvum]|uniref:Methylmalonyl-CoA mutase family protein n=1 Tax=Intrasporangium calvum TaxID=53358 RepID=A0ABT5GF81_9MICO|nr:methylmalonyl-CoA mutase family protein [Intrasporangium calvum]MDC5696540.1 methylmalonyl-CoA mutase family protein [Intrasporangium calvum]